ncbi:MAG TPA: hypothetical protein VGL20_10260 [Candidatus Dormibacteraeota bacterium]|jgi:hypothetical protein
MALLDHHATPEDQATTFAGRTRYRVQDAGPAWWPWRWRVCAVRPTGAHAVPVALPVGRRMRREEAEHEAAWQNACETKRLNKALLLGVRA